MKGTSSCCQAGPLHPQRRRPCLVDRHVQPPRGGTYQRSRVSGHQLCGRAPRRQRAGRRRTVGAGSNRRAHVSSASKYSRRRAAPPAGWRPTGSSSSTDAGHGTRASRKPLQPSSSTAAPAPRLGLRLGLRLGFWLGFVHHRSPYRITLRRRPRRQVGAVLIAKLDRVQPAASPISPPVDASGRPPGPPDARTGARRRSVTVRKRAIGRRPPCRRTTHGTSTRRRSRRQAPLPGGTVVAAPRGAAPRVGYGRAERSIICSASSRSSSTSAALAGASGSR